MWCLTSIQKGFIMSEIPDYMPRAKMMISKLHDQVARGFIENEWAEQFISDVKDRLDHDCILTAKQIDKIEELFERY